MQFFWCKYRHTLKPLHWLFYFCYGHAFVIWNVDVGGNKAANMQHARTPFLASISTLFPLHLRFSNQRERTKFHARCAAEGSHIQTSTMERLFAARCCSKVWLHTGATCLQEGSFCCHGERIERLATMNCIADTIDCYANVIVRL